MQPDPKKKFAKPKIMLFDLAPEASTALRDIGCAISEGSFGKGYPIPAGHGYCQVLGSDYFPGLMEMEVLVIDLGAPEPLPDS